MATCSKCKQDKPDTAFYKTKREVVDVCKCKMPRLSE